MDATAMVWHPPPQPSADIFAPTPDPELAGLPPWRTVAPELAGCPLGGPAPFVPYAPPTPQAPASRPLTAPIWERQAEEPLTAWTAFQGFLAPGAGGTMPGRQDGPVPGLVGNWAEAGAWIAESSRGVLEAMAVEWSWEARRTAQAAFNPRKVPAAEVRAQRAEARRLQAQATDLANAELAKLIEESKATPAMRLSVKELIALVGRIGGIEVMRERAGILESLAGASSGAAAPGINWDAMTDDELEAYRRLGERVGV